MYKVIEIEALENGNRHTVELNDDSLVEVFEDVSAKQFYVMGMNGDDGPLATTLSEAVDWALDACRSDEEFEQRFQYTEA